MDKTICVVKGSSCYSANRSGTERLFTLGEETGYMIEPSKVEQTIINDICQRHLISVNDRESILHEFSQTGIYEKVDLEDEHTYFSITKMKDAELDCICVESATDCVTYSLYYTIYTCSPDDVRFLPLREFTNSANRYYDYCMYRSETPLYKDLDSAKEALANLGYVGTAKWPYLEEEHKLMVLPQKVFDEEKDWYKDELELTKVMKTEPCEYWATYSPIIDEHLKKLKDLKMKQRYCYK